MRTDYESMVKEFLPALRASAAKLMAQRYGISQVEIARLLGTTQAAVSKYLSGSYSAKVRAIEVQLSRGEVEGFVRSVVNGEGYEAQRSVCKMCAKNLTHRCGLMVK